MESKIPKTKNWIITSLEHISLALSHLNDGGLQLTENAACTAALKEAAGGVAVIGCYDQGNALASRKKVLPLLADPKTGLVTKLNT